MSILTKYLCKYFFKFFLLCQVVFVAVYLVVDFLEKIDDFMEAEAAGDAVVAFFLYKIPLIMVQMAPVAVLISVIVMFSLMKKNNEIIALKASGIGLMRVSFPVVAASVGLAAAVFLSSEWVVPYTSSKSQEIWKREVKKQNPDQYYRRDHIWYRSGNAIYWIRHFDGDRMVMDDPVFYFFDDSFRLIKKVQGRKAVWTGSLWRIERGTIQEAAARGEYVFSTFDEMDLRLPERPEAFLRTVKKPEEMSYWELKRYAERVQTEGYDPTTYFVELNIKLAFPFINVVMVLMGISIALRRKRGGTPLSVCIGIGVCFLYLLSLGVTRSFGLSGILPPVFSAWVAKGIFLLLGIYWMMGVET
jgi:lipopolysaccharide export system permease protein